jgi:hypothetical protein
MVSTFILLNGILPKFYFRLTTTAQSHHLNLAALHLFLSFQQLLEPLQGFWNALIFINNRPEARERVSSVLRTLSQRTNSKSLRSRLSSKSFAKSSKSSKRDSNKTGLSGDLSDDKDDCGFGSKDVKEIEPPAQEKNGDDNKDDAFIEEGKVPPQ